MDKEPVQTQDNQEGQETADQRAEREAQDQAQPVVSARAKAMEEIEKAWETKANTDASETVPVTDEEGKPIAPELVEAARAANAAAETAESPASGESVQSAPSPAESASQEQDQPTQPIDPNAEYDVVVDGKPLKIKGSKIFDAGIRAISKDTAADVRLELANRILAEAERRTKGAIPSGDVPPSDAPPKEPDIDLKAIARTIQLGTEEQAVEALNTFAKSLKGNTTTPEQLLQTLEGPLTAKLRDEMAFQQAQAFVNAEYGDLMKDEYMRRLFLTEERRRRAPREHGGEGLANVPYVELYKSIGDDLRKHFNRPKPNTAPGTQSMEQRVEAKAKAPQVPRSAAQRLEGTPAKQPETTLDVINQMRKGRHQPTLQ